MPAGADAVWPSAPRVAADLGACSTALADEVSWSDVQVGHAASFFGSASDIEVMGARLDGVRLTGAVLESGRWADVEVQDCELSATTLDDSRMARVEFRNCRMSGLIAIGIKAKDVRFVDCKLDGANFRGAMLDRCAFEDSDLRDVDFYGATLRPGRLVRCTLAAAEFSKAKCEGLDLRGSELAGVKGATSLRDCVITLDQMVPLGLALVATLNVRVDDQRGTGQS